MAKGLSDFDVSYTPEDAQRLQPNRQGSNTIGSSPPCQQQPAVSSV